MIRTTRITRHAALAVTALLLSASAGWAQLHSQTSMAQWPAGTPLPVATSCTLQPVFALGTSSGQARANWSSAAANTYGHAYGNWRLAMHKMVSYNLVGGVAVYQARATPCRRS